MPAISSSRREEVVSFEQARHLVEQAAGALLTAGIRKETEQVPLLESRGRVLAQELRADRDFPPFRRAARDGYALRSADTGAASEKTPVRLKVVGEIAAGTRALPEIHEGEGAEIMTGAPTPDGADAIVMVEHTESAETGWVHVLRPVRQGENVVAKGSEARQGDMLLNPGAILLPPAIAVAAGVGCAELLVYARPRVAVLATGNELVDVAVQPAAHQIRNSNAYSLAAQVQAAGAKPYMLPIAPDEKPRLTELVREGLTADLLLIAGGVSMGKYDLVEEVLTELGAEFLFTGARIQPGKPIVFGRIPNQPGSSKYFFGLPGNPVSTMVTFDLFVRPVIEALAGAQPEKLYFVKARLKSEIRTKTGLTRFLPGMLSGECEATEVEVVRWQGSGDTVATAQANCYIVVPPNCESIPAGEMVSLFRRT